MNEAAIRNVIAQEFRALQQRLGDRMVTRTDINGSIDRVMLAMPNKRELETIRGTLDEIKYELRAQRQLIKQQSLYIESLTRDTKAHSNQIGTLWRFVQQ